MAAQQDESPDSTQFWKRLLAVGSIAGDLSSRSIARFAGVHSLEAEEALAMGRRTGLINPDGTIDELMKLRLISDMPKEEVAGVHAAVARHLFAAGPDRLREAVQHARAAGTMVESEEMVAMADHGGRMSLLLGDYRSAFDLLNLADDLDLSNNLSEQGRRLCDLASACDGLGDVATARGFLARAVSLGDLAADSSLVARAAVQYALPVDWYAGDARAARLLHKAEEMTLDRDDSTAVRAARALVEMRVPLSGDDGHQLAWITRPAVAQVLADEALQDSTNCSSAVRCLSLISWRSTHRAPQYLARRREISNEALDLSQNQRNPSHQIEAAVCLAVDALESGDRPLFDHALAVSRWVADRDGNPRLLWRAYCLAAGAALLDRNLEEAERFRILARQAGESIQSPGWLGADIVFSAQIALEGDRYQNTRMFMFGEDHPALANPLGRAGSAFAFALQGDLETAERYARRALRQPDPEASYLLLLSRLAQVACLIRAEDLTYTLIDLITPWSNHFAVDANAWWINGPMTLSLAELHHTLGDDVLTKSLLEKTVPVARSMNDVRALQRIELLAKELPKSDKSEHTSGLTERESRVLQLLVEGSTNPQIARTLAFSVSTIRDDTTSIYRKLQVKGRAEAVGRAIQLGLISKPS